MPFELRRLDASVLMNKIVNDNILIKFLNSNLRADNLGLFHVA